MRTLYLDCETGISGDMIVASLLDLGADEDAVTKALSGVKGGGFDIRISRKERAGIDCCDFDVVLHKGYENHDHDMEYLYGHLRGERHDGHYHDIHSHGDNNGHKHHDPGRDIHDRHHGEGGHVHRTLGDVEEIINALRMTDSARRLAIKVFRILAGAEAKAHGRRINDVSFHEVGALDSIADVVAASVCFDSLGIGEVIIPKICEGSGNVRTQHGILPVPVPAVINIASEYGLPLCITGRKGELVTPTGAAFAAAVMTSSRLPAVFNVRSCGYGAGKREYGIPSILRAMFIEYDLSGSDTVWKLETNIDDSTGEILGYVMKRLLSEGARDVYYTPIYMKKNRPAYLLSVIATPDKIPVLEDIIFRETTTIGIRRCPMERSLLSRKQIKVATGYGECDAKVCGHRSEEYVYPEYESAVKLAEKSGMSLRDAYDLIRSEYYGRSPDRYPGDTKDE